MPFWIIRGRITQEYADAIVSSTNTRQQGGDNVTAAVFREGGRELKQAYDSLGGVAPGKAKASDGYSLPCRHVIHTSAPVWKNGANGETEQLVSCYEESLRLCGELGCASAAFPLISACSDPGQDEPLIRIAMETIRRYLEDHDLTVCLVCPDTVMYSPDSKRYLDIREYIGQKSDAGFGPAGSPGDSCPGSGVFSQAADCGGGVFSAPTACWDGGLWDDDMSELAVPHPGGIMPDAALFSYLRKYQDESFRDMLLRKIDEKHMTDAECYRKANIDRKLFNKIKNQPGYHPGKPTVLALAVALELPLEETQELLHKAGFYLSHSDRFDLIVEYFIREGDYDIYRINEALFFFDLRLLGSLA